MRPTAMVVATVLAGCVVRGDPGEWRFGPADFGDECDDDLDCAGGGLRCDGAICTSGCIEDDECPSPWACGYPADERTDAYGCYERCTGDLDCQAGFVCASDGACVDG